MKIFRTDDRYIKPGRVYSHHLVGTGWQSRVGEIPSPFVVVFDVEFRQFGELNLQLATSVVDVLSVENLSRVFCGVTRTVFNQRLRTVIGARTEKEMTQLRNRENRIGRIEGDRAD